MSETGAGMGGAARGLGGRPPRGGADATAAAGQAVGLVSRPAGPLRGELRVPGDKSISHRALLIGALALGETRIRGLLEADDVLSTAQALSALGAAVRSDGEGLWRVAGRGVGGLGEPERVLDMGNSGTGARLLMGVVASHPFAATFTGDASLVTRPMVRVADPLVRMGATIVARSGWRLPLTIVGATEPVPIAYRVPVPSAQVKSAILLAALNAPGRTTVIEPAPTRDHSEIMLAHFGVEIEREDAEDGARRVTLVGQPEIFGRDVTVPGDLSSAAFPLVAALITPGSAVTLRGVGVNPMRTGLIESLQAMGALITVANRRLEGGEPVADLEVQASALTGVDVPAERAPRMIDEYPVLATAAAYARGRTRLRGLSELRVKESDRLAAIAEGLARAEVRVALEGDDLVIEGAGGPPNGGALIATRLDHRIAMAFLVLGVAARQPMRIDQAAPISTSFPGFVEAMNGLGADIRPDGESG